MAKSMVTTSSKILLKRLRTQRESKLKKAIIGNLKINGGNLIEKIRIMDSFECLLEKASKTKYKNIFEVKGAMSIRSLVGKNFVPTGDLDINTYKIMDQQEILKMINEIIEVPSKNEYIKFQVIKSSPIRENNSSYNCFRVDLEIHYFDLEIKSEVKIDVSCHDVTFKNNIKKFKNTLTNEEIDINVCPLEISLAEKIHSMFITTGGINFKRTKDYHSFYFVVSNFTNCINEKLLFEALRKVFKQRNAKIDFVHLNQVIDYMLMNKRFAKESESFFKNRCFVNFVDSKPVVIFLKKFFNFLERNKDKLKDIVIN